MRSDGRQADQLRPVEIITGFQKFASGSALVRWGDTHVLCAASVEERVPPFREASGGGWVTGEYAMLPGSTHPRKGRRTGGRESEIKRLIGRSLRAAIDLDALGPRTITIDCDVLQADGGTRVASITGGYVALALAVDGVRAAGLLEGDPMLAPVAAVSVGIVGGEPLLDLPYSEDSRAEVDMNVVMTAQQGIIELQGTAEQGTFDRAQLDRLYTLAWSGIEKLCALQRAVIERARQAGASITVALADL